MDPLPSPPSSSGDPSRTDSKRSPLPNSRACMLCRQRKVKCDKSQPCANCVRSRNDCIHSGPARSRPRRGKTTEREEILLSRLRRYEAVLNQYGAKLEDLQVMDDPASGIDDATVRSTLVEPNVQNSDTIIVTAKADFNQSNPLWGNLSDEILDEYSPRHRHTSDADDTTSEPIYFDVSSAQSLTQFHPSPLLIFRLWQTFLDNVNPLTKVIHAPTVQREILEAIDHLEQLSKPFEALMFAIYASAVTSLNDEQCMKMNGQSRQSLRAKYCQIARQALSQAGVFGTKDIVVLQAALLLHISLRPDHPPGEFWVLCGVVTRVGQRIGLHSEYKTSQFSVLETQIRRRLWWQICVLDRRCAERCGVNAPNSPNLWQTPLPLNVNDSDLSLNITVPPTDNVGSTEMIFCLMMYEIGNFLRNSPSMASIGASSQEPPNPAIRPFERETGIIELEQMLHRKYLQYCNSGNSIHVLAQSVVKVICGRMRLMTCHPRQFADRGASMTKHERDQVFAICLTMIEQDNLSRSNPAIQGFLWHVDFHFQVDAFVYLLSELQYQTDSSVADRTWSEISKAFNHHPEMITDIKKPLNTALCKLTIKTWDARELGLKTRNPLENREAHIQVPLFVSEIQARLPFKETLGYPSPESWERSEMSSHSAKSAGDEISTDSNDARHINMASAEFDWNYWNDLMAEATASAHSPPLQDHNEL